MELTELEYQEFERYWLNKWPLIKPDRMSIEKFLEWRDHKDTDK